MCDLHVVLTSLLVSPSLEVKGRINLPPCLNICCYRRKLFSKDGGAALWLSALRSSSNIFSMSTPLICCACVESHGERREISLGPVDWLDGELQVSLYLFYGGGS